MKNIVFTFLLFSLLSSCTKKADSEIFLIPNNLDVVVIVFNQSEGDKKEFFKGSRIYNIPQSGILYTQFDKVSGILNQKVYFSENRNKEVKYLVSDDKKNDNEKYILDIYDGSFNPINRNLNNKEKNVNWIYFTIGKKSDNKEMLRKKANVIIDKIINSYPNKIVKEIE